MGTKEEPICLSDSDNLEGETELTPIMVSSSSDEDDQMDWNNCNRRRYTSRSTSELKISKTQLNLLRATVKLKKLNAADVSPKKPNSTTTALRNDSTCVNGFDSTISNGLGYVIYNISDDELEMPSYLFPEDSVSEELETNIVTNAGPDRGERSTVPVLDKVKEEENAESPSSSTQEDEGLFQKLERLGSSCVPQNHCDSNFKNENIESFFTELPKRAVIPSLSTKKGKTTCHNIKMKQATFESLSPHKKLFPYMPMQRQFQALPLTPPLHSTVNLPPSGFYRGFFTESQMNLIEALQEEGFNELILNLTRSYMSTRRAPPPQLVFYILAKILLCGRKQAITTLAYLTLKRIQVLHPSSTDMHNCGLDWDFMTAVVEQMELSGCRCEHPVKNSSDSCQASQNASLAFVFILQVLEKECERKQLSTGMRKCLAYKLLSLNKAFRNVRNVLQWIKEAADCHQSDMCSHNSGLRSSCLTSIAVINCDCVSSSPNLPCPLSLMQHLLQLVMVVNEQPRDCASQIADELVSCYLGLRSLERKTLLLETLESHLVRSEMVDCVLRSRFPMEDISSSGISLPTGLRKIVDHHFYRELQYDGDHSVVDSSNDYHFESLQQEVEEFVMLLAYLMQSYICLHEEKLQAQQVTNCDSFDDQDSVSTCRDGLHLSVEDVVTLCDVSEHVGMLRQRLEKVCPMFSQRTDLLFELMNSMSSFTS